MTASGRREERGPGGLRRNEAEELAGLLARPAALRLARRLQSHGWLDVARPAPGRGSGSAAEPRPISIWRPRQVNGELVFERPETTPWGDHYATRTTLPAARPAHRKRICLFGESTAAGYLYAPHLTPAGILEEQLRHLAGDDRWEVIDLARTNERLSSLVDTVAASLQLDPDLLVVFAGNNWNLLETPRASPYHPAVGARLDCARRLRRGGLAEAVDAAGRQRLRRAAAALAEIAEIAARRALDVVVVVPEVNLADWHSRQPAPWLPGAGNRRWLELYRCASEALAARRFTDTARLAREMLELDGGLVPTAYRLLAEAWRGQGRIAEAAAACRAEVAADQYATLCFLSAPRATPDSQELLRRAAAGHGFACVDLPEVFAAHTGSPLPGRRLFLDYCHLTIEGMKVAMAATAAAVLRLDGQAAGDWRRLLARLPDPRVTPEADATAKLGAVLHGAHRHLSVGPGREILEHWCREALAASPAVWEAMLDLIAARASPLPAVLTAAQTRNRRSRFPLSLQHGWRSNHLDLDATAAMVETLEQSGRDVRSEALARLVAGHAVGERPLELADSARYLVRPLERLFPEAMADERRRALEGALWPATRFHLICADDRPVELRLVARLPALGGDGGERTGTLEVALNGRGVGSLELGRRWRRGRFVVERGIVENGVNEIALLWPSLPGRGDEALEEAIRRLELGREASLHPVFGELYSLTARRSGPRSATRQRRRLRRRPLADGGGGHGRRASGEREPAGLGDGPPRRGHRDAM